MITTSNPDWDQKFRLLKHQGMSVSDSVRHGAKEVIYESYPVLGYNYRMTDVQAAIGREQLKRLPELVERRRFLATRYKELLADVPGVRLPQEPLWARSNWQSYCVSLPSGCDQRLVMQKMLDADIATRRGIMCAHREAAYSNSCWSCGSIAACDCPPATCARLKQSEYAQDNAVLLPLFHQMTEQDQSMVAAALRDAVI
jgi:dTDP-4-amino-4,6-dideoxygalactose transaminase